jgi:Tfp pilus assembly protein PilN
MTGTLASTGDGVPVPGAPPAAVADADLTALAEAADDSVWLRSVATRQHLVAAHRIALALLAARDEARKRAEKAEGERDALELVVIKAVTHLDQVAHDAAHRGDQDDEAIELAGQLTAALPTTRRDGA